MSVFYYSIYVFDYTARLHTKQPIIKLCVVLIMVILVCDCFINEGKNFVLIYGWPKTKMFFFSEWIQTLVNPVVSSIHLLAIPTTSVTVTNKTN